MSKSVEEIASAIERMSQSDREELLLRMARMDDILEDLDDIADLIRASHESSRPFDEFVEELRAKGRDI